VIDERKNRHPGRLRPLKDAVYSKIDVGVFSAYLHYSRNRWRYGGSE
jgi:hypothetical protein